MTAFYNEVDPYAAQWLRNLIAAGHIAPGVVDERDIRDVRAAELDRFNQCHFFAGIGGWSLALRLAGWPDDKPVWTGSCPCQSFSVAGKQAGFSDERHLWPTWFNLIRECRPPVVFGEQVEGAVRHGWLDLVQADLEGEGYALGAAVLGAHGVGAPNIRLRLYFGAKRLADSDRRERDGVAELRGSEHDGENAGWPQGGGEFGARGDDGGLADTAEPRWNGGKRRFRGEDRRSAPEPGRLCDAGGLADANGGGSQARREAAEAARYRSSALADGGDHGADPLNGFWRDADWLGCRDGKWRPVVPSHVGVFDGLPDDLVRGGDSGIRDDAEEEREQVDGQASEADAGEVVQGMRRVDTPLGQERSDRRTRNICEARLLQSDVHVVGDAQGCVQEPEPQPCQGSANSKVELRNVRGRGKATRSPHGREPFEQYPVKLEDVVPTLPSSLALAKLHGRWRDAEALQALCEAICKSGSVQFAPEQASEIWRSLGREDQDRIRLDFGHIWVARSFSPLSQSEPGRVMRLRAYGNAIVPQVAAAFIRGIME